MHGTVPAGNDKIMSRMAAMEARDAAAEAEKEEKLKSDDSENVSSNSSSDSTSATSGDDVESTCADETVVAPQKEQKHLPLAPTGPDEPDERPIIVRLNSLRRRLTQGLFHGGSGHQSKWPSKNP